MLLIVTVGRIVKPKGETVAVPSSSTDMTVRQIAPTIDATDFAIAKKLHLPRGFG